jgi:hypothetical protein
MLTAQLDAGEAYDDEELARLTRRLRGELLDLDVDSVEFADRGDAPEGTKGIGLQSVGELVLRCTVHASVLRSIVDATVAWLGRQRARSVKLTLDGDTLEVTGLSSDDQMRLIELWVARHAADG